MKRIWLHTKKHGEVSYINFNSRLTHIKNSLNPELVRRNGVINSINSLKNAMSPEKISDGTYAKTVVRFLLEARDSKKGKDLMTIASIMGKEPELFSKYLKFDHNGYRVDYSVIDRQSEQIREDEDVKKYFGVIAQNMQKVVKTQKTLRLRNAKLSEVKKIPRVTAVDKGQAVKRMKHQPGKVYRKKDKIPDDAMGKYMGANGVDIVVAPILETRGVGTKDEREIRTAGIQDGERAGVQAEKIVLLEEDNPRDEEIGGEGKKVEIPNNLPAPIQNENIFKKIGNGIAKLGENIRKIFPGKRREEVRKKSEGEKAGDSEGTLNASSWLNRQAETPVYTPVEALRGEKKRDEDGRLEDGIGEL